MSFAEELQKVRSAKGITQEELAEMLGISRQSVSKWERGEGYPEVETLISIAKKLRLSLDELMSEELACVTDFESLSTLDADICRSKLKKLPKETIIKACMGTSPTNAAWIAGLLTDIDFDKEFASIGRIRIQEVEDAQNEVLAVINT